MKRQKCDRTHGMLTWPASVCHKPSNNSQMMSDFPIEDLPGRAGGSVAASACATSCSRLCLWACSFSSCQTATAAPGDTAEGQDPDGR
jgi:hypothetical protein